MSVIYCQLCHASRDTDYVNCEIVTIPARKLKDEPICGDCFNDLAEHVPANERAGVLHDGKPIDWSEWGEPTEGVLAYADRCREAGAVETPRRHRTFEQFYRSWGVVEIPGPNYDGENVRCNPFGGSKAEAEQEAVRMTAEDEDGKRYEARRICDMCT